MMNAYDGAAATLALSISKDQLFVDQLGQLQAARLEALENLRLEDIFDGRNLYHLRAAYHSAAELVSDMFDRYLFAEDEARFDELPMPAMDPVATANLFARGKLPLHFELQEARVNCLHRLLHDFYLRLCNEDATINWQLLARFVAELKSTEFA